MDNIWKKAQEITSLLREAGRVAEDGYKNNASRQEANLKNANARMLGEQLAEEFGTLHGWRRANRPFSLDQLAENRKARNWRAGEFFHGGLFLDHPFWYRLNGFPVAIAVQNYAPYYLEELENECKRRRLVWEEVTNFPSWHNPGGTKLILITRSEQPR